MAEKGNAEAQYRLSVCYLRGVGVGKDITKSVEWFKKANEQGERLDIKDTIETLQSFKDDAEQGDAEAQYSLGMCDAYGAGVYSEPEMTAYSVDGESAIVPNYENAVKWFKKAAEQGHIPAQYELGASYIHYNYRGLKSDFSNAVEWLTKAAEKGYAPAQIELGKFYDVFGTVYEYGTTNDKENKAALKVTQAPKEDAPAVKPLEKPEVKKTENGRLVAEESTGDTPAPCCDWRYVAVGVVLLLCLCAVVCLMRRKR